MAFDNNDVKSINSSLIILSLSCAGTVGRDTIELSLVLNHGLLPAVNRFSMVLCTGYQ